MNWGIIRKSFFDSLLIFTGCAIGMMAFAFIFAWAMQNMGVDLFQFLGKYPWLSKIFEASFGIKISDEVSLSLLIGVSYTHLMILTLLCTFVIASVTRLLAGEVESGTADLLLTMPVSRSNIYCSQSLVWVLMLGVLCFSPLFGIWVFTVTQDFDDPIVLGDFLPVTLNFFALGIAIGGFGSLVSCCTNYRFKAIGWVAGICLASMMVNFVEPFLPQLSFLQVVNLLAYFRPVDVLRLEGIPWRAITTLTVFGAVLWFAGLVWFQRKDIPAA